ncbi:MAG: hypothetical protein ACREFT_01840 [Acetobacteraceae bacterium]
MSLIVKALKSTVAIACAAVFVHIGSAAAASPPVDFQQQVRRVLDGTLAIPSNVRPDSSSPLDRDINAQAFVRRLLLGVSISTTGAADPVKRPQRTAALEMPESASALGDTQATVRQLLLGQHASMRGGL